MCRVTIYVLETSIDRDIGPVFGSLRKLLQRVPSRVVERLGGAMPITVQQFGR